MSDNTNHISTDSAEQIDIATLTLRADADCKVCCNKNTVVILDANKIVNVSAPLGTYCLQFVSLENDQVCIERKVDLESADCNYLVDIKDLAEVVKESKKNGISYKYRDNCNDIRNWFGPVVNGKPNGHGKIQWSKDNCEYEYVGEVIDGIENGWGYLLRINYDEKTCPKEYSFGFHNWKDGVLDEGKSVYIHGGRGLNSTIERAIMKNGKKYYSLSNALLSQDTSGPTYSDLKWFSIEQKGGKIIATNINGDVFEGWEWSNGLIKDSSGNRYYGALKHNNGEDYVCKEGHGTMIYSNGNVYVGEWKCNERSGHGTMTYSNGDVYVGEWENNVRSGHGKMFYANGGVYEGEWKQNERSGQGKMIYANGNVYDGKWGEYYPGMKWGYGVMTYANGEVFAGEWNNDQKVEKK